MNKGLIALGRITGTQNLTMYEQNECLKTIEEELKRLEELEKAFKALSKDYEKAMKELSKEIEKNRGFEIIKKKKLVKNGLLTDMDLKQYNWCALKFGDKTLTKEEYDLLKKVLKDE